MLIDARQLPDDHLIETDVCVVGAGPAGISVATVLGAARTRVVLLAGGGLSFDATTQSLYDAATEGDPYLLPLENRRRQFGGTSNMWAVKMGNGRMGVRYAALDPLDFESRPWVPHSGWPISYDTLVPYYERAHRLCEAGPFDYAPTSWVSEKTPLLPLDGTALRTRMFHFGPSEVFWNPDRNGLKTSSHVEVYLDGHATHIVGEGEVDEIQCRSTPQKTFRVRAKHYVLACGGIETPRLLLAANHARGIGTGRESLGRYYMDHPIISAGHLLPSDKSLFQTTALYDLRLVDGEPIMATLVLSPEAQRQQELLNACVSLMPQPNEAQLEALLAVWRLIEVVESRSPKFSALRDLARVAAQLPHLGMVAIDRITREISLVQGLGKGGWSKLRRPQRRYTRFELLMYSEQEPDPENRVELTDSLDAMGVPKARVRWTWGGDTVERLTRARKTIKESLEAAGLGKVDPRRGHDFATAGIPQGIAHHLGATRMHADPSLGVVDADCRVHGVNNLYVASSSVFPAGGYANPTLTIVALALRLADHLEHHLH